MRSWFLLLLLIFLGVNRCEAQKLPREFVEGISKAIKPVGGTANDSLDVYSVILVLSPDGLITSTIFSVGTPETLKMMTRDRLAITRIKLTPLQQWWGKFCRDNRISENTLIAQSVFVRFEDTDGLSLPVDKVSEIYRSALSFDDQTLQVMKKVNVIWLPPIVHRFEHVNTVD